MTTDKTPVETDKYVLQKFLLRFQEDSIETSYRKNIVSATLNYVRLAWLSVILFGGFFAFLDTRFFAEHAPTIIVARAVLLSFAAIVFALTWWTPFKRILVWSPAIFILSVGTFCTLQTAFSPHDAYSPYIMGVFLAFCGTFITVGMGFTYSFFALVASFLIFELFIGVLEPVTPFVFILYNFFYVCFVLAFIFLGYYTEIVSRKQFITSAQLQDSLDNIQTLRGLLPICASCKQIRDDKGYWNQIESYLAKHSDMEFSHSICPDCLEKIYPDLHMRIKDKHTGNTGESANDEPVVS